METFLDKRARRQARARSERRLLFLLERLLASALSVCCHRRAHPRRVDCPAGVRNLLGGRRPQRLQGHRQDAGVPQQVLPVRQGKQRGVVHTREEKTVNKQLHVRPWAAGSHLMARPPTPLVPADAQHRSTKVTTGRSDHRTHIDKGREDRLFCGFLRSPQQKLWLPHSFHHELILQTHAAP